MRLNAGVRAAASVTILLAVWAFVPRDRAVHAARPPSVSHPPHAIRPSTAQRMYAPLPKGGWTDAEVILNNNSPGPMTVSATFYADGVGAAAPATTLQPAEVRWVKLSEWSGGVKEDVQSIDAIELTTIGHPMELGAQVILLRASRRGSVDVPFTAAPEYRSSVQEAVWAAPAGARSTVVLGNASDATVIVGVRSDRASEEIELPPHATRTIHGDASPKDSPTTANWMRIDVRGPRASVRATGFVEVRGRVSGGIRFYDSSGARSRDLFATNLHVGDAWPMMALKNTSNETITATPQFRAFDGSSQPVELPALTLPPHGAAVVDVTPLLNDVSARKDLAHVGVHIVNNGPPGALIGGLSPVSRDGARAYDVPLRETGPSSHATGSYPWRIDGDSTTVVSLTNVSDRPAKYHARIAYPGNVYWLPEADVPVGATVAFDLRRLRDDAVRDMYGHILPPTLAGGQFRWSSVGAPGETQLAGRAEIVSASTDRSSSYSCFICCGDSVNYGFLSPGELAVAVGFTDDTGIYAHWYDCYGNDGGSYPDSATSWDVQAPSVTSAWTVQTGVGRVSGNGAGTSWIQGNWTGYHNFQDPNDWELCAYDYVYVTAPGDVSTACAVPTNFRQNGGGVDVGGGTLRFYYFWDSSTGRTSDLAGCQIGETATYNAGDIPFPPPFPYNAPPNPTENSGPASGSQPATDNHITPGQFRTPYTIKDLNATQTYWYTCSCENGGARTTLMGPHYITRSVNQHTNNAWFFLITKLGSSATIDPLP